MNHFY
jgi:hypothetical protein